MADEEEAPAEKPAAEDGVITMETIDKLTESRKRVQELNNTIKDLRCQEIFTYRNQNGVTHDLLTKMAAANTDFLENIGGMWGKTEDILRDLELDRIVSGELSYVPSSVIGLHTKVTRSESFEKLCSKKLPRVIVCGTETSEMVPRIIVCEDKNSVVPTGDCANVQSSRNMGSTSRLSQSQYTSYGGRFC